MTAQLVCNPHTSAVHDNLYDTHRRPRAEVPACWNPSPRFSVLSRFCEGRGCLRGCEVFGVCGWV